MNQLPHLSSAFFFDLLDTDPDAESGVSQPDAETLVQLIEWLYQNAVAAVQKLLSKGVF